MVAVSIWISARYYPPTEEKKCTPAPSNENVDCVFLQEYAFDSLLAILTKMTTGCI